MGGMRLLSVSLQSFKAYKESAIAGPFDERLTTIIGPNGSGKSCAIEAICFALGAPTTASLSSLVHRTASHGNAAVAVRFASSATSHFLVVQRRIIGGRRSEWSVQHCQCSCGDESEARDASPFCSCCTVERQVKREALRASLKTSVGIDIDRPERWVVHQSTAVAVAKKTPPELLAFLEGVIGTEALRDGVQNEAARSHDLQSRLQESIERCAAERMVVGRNAPAMLAFKSLEQSRARLVEQKRRHLKLEYAFHTQALRQTDADVEARAREVEGLRHELRAREAALADVAKRASANEDALNKARHSLTLANRAVGRHKDAASKVKLERKQHASAEARASKAIAALRARLTATHDDERTAHLAQATAIAEARRAQEQLQAGRTALDAREAAMSALEQGQGEDATAASGGVQVADEEATEVLRLEVELRRLCLGQSGGGPLLGSHSSQLAASLAAERARKERRHKAEQKEVERLRAARDAAADKLLAARSTAEARDRALEEATADQARHTSLQNAAEKRAATALEALNRHQEQLDSQQAQLQQSTALASIDKRAAAVRRLRAGGGSNGGGALSTRVYGFLCELMTCSAAHSVAVNAALGSALHSTVVVQDKTTALAVVGHFARQRIGIVTCIILDEIPDAHSASATASEAPAGCLPLEQCITCSQRFRPLVSKLVRRWALAPNSDVALEATSTGAARPGKSRATAAAAGAKATAKASDGPACHVVTLKGECFLSSGEMQQAATRRADSFAVSSHVQSLSRPVEGGAGAALTEEASGLHEGIAQMKEQLADLHDKVDAAGRQHASLRLQADQHAADASDAVSRMGAARTARERQDEVVASSQEALSKAEKTHEIKLAALAERIDGQASAPTKATEREQHLRRECERLRAAQVGKAAGPRKANKARSSSTDDETPVDDDLPDPEAVAWHVLHERVISLTGRAQALAEAQDAARCQSRAAVESRRALEVKDKALASQLLAAKRASHAAGERQNAVEAKLSSATAAVESESAKREALSEEGSTVTAEREEAMDALSSARSALRHALHVSEQEAKDREAQCVALALLESQIRQEASACCVQPGARDDDATSTWGTGQPPARLPKRRKTCDVDGENENAQAADDDPMDDDPMDDDPMERADAIEMENEEPHTGHAREAKDAGGDDGGSGGTQEVVSLKQISSSRLDLQAEERVFASKQRALDVDALEAYLAAVSAVSRLSAEVDSTRAEAEQSARRVEVLQAERSRTFLAGLRAIDDGLRTTFRSLCKHGDCTLEFASEPSILFTEGVGIAVKPPRAEWTRFEMLSGGQQALVAVALNLSLHEADGAPFCLFDEIDAALDTQRVQALAEHVRSRNGSQSIFVSHRRELIEASGRLLGVYTCGGGSQAVSLGFAP